jgi:tRNA-splicing ligase RtcB
LRALHLELFTKPSSESEDFMSTERIHLEKIDDCRYRIPRSGKMRVDGIIYADAKLIRNIHEDESPRQVANVAHLPGILEHSLAMPDIH